MGLLIEGIGDGWVVLRRVGSRAEILTFGSLDEMKRLVTRELAKVQQQVQAPVAVGSVNRIAEREPVLLPSASDFVVPLAAPINGSKPPVPADVDCRACGACCAPLDQNKDTHAGLETEDVAKIPAVMRNSLVVVDGGRAYMRTKMTAGVTVCAALTGSIGRCKCGIYSKRPMACAMFEKGSEECLAARSERRVRCAT